MGGFSPEARYFAWRKLEPDQKFPRERAARLSAAHILGNDKAAQKPFMERACYSRTPLRRWIISSQSLSGRWRHGRHSAWIGGPASGPSTGHALLHQEDILFKKPPPSEHSGDAPLSGG